MTDFNIVELPNNLFKLAMHIPEVFHKDLLGFKRQIEKQTNTVINIPQNTYEVDLSINENIEIKGESQGKVSIAGRQISTLLHLKRSRMSRTHFVAVLLNFGEIRKNFVEFKKQILLSKLPGINENLFQTKARLHLTIMVNVLLDDIEEASAIKVLEACREHLANLRTPFDVHVSGLGIWNKDASATRLLFAHVKAPQLEKFGNRCFKTFLKNHLTFEEFGRKTVAFHMTVLSTSFLKDGNPNKLLTFDAREILKKYRKFNFGTVQVNAVHFYKFGEHIEDGENTGCYKSRFELKF